jgi:hypothetical protein
LATHERKADSQEIQASINWEQSPDEPNDEYFVGPLLGLDFRMGRGAHMVEFGSYKDYLETYPQQFCNKKNGEL